VIFVVCIIYFVEFYSGFTAFVIFLNIIYSMNVSEFNVKIQYVSVGWRVLNSWTTGSLVPVILEASWFFINQFTAVLFAVAYSYFVF